MDTNPKETAPKGSNLLSIFGIIILVVLVIIVIVAISMMKKATSIPSVKQAIDLEPKIEAMMDQTLNQIETQAVAITATELAADPTGYNDRYLVVTGNLSKEESIGVSQNIAMNIFNERENYNGYVLDDAIVVIDLTGEGPQGQEGDLLKAYGLLFVLAIEDVWEIPIVGPNLKQEFANVEGMSEKVVFLVARGVQLIDQANEEGDEEMEAPVMDGEEPAAEGDEMAEEGEPMAEDGAAVEEEAPAEDETPAEEPVEEPTDE